MGETKLVRGRWIIPGAEDAALENGGVAVRDGLVAAVGDWEEIRRSHPGAAVIGSERMAVLPGLINAHHHSKGVSTIQHGVRDMLLEPWLLALRGTRGGDRHLEVLLSAAAQLRSGVTTVVDVISSGGDAVSFSGVLHETLRAYDKAGIRARIAAGISTRSHIVHGAGEDERFLRSLPAHLRRSARSKLVPGDQITEDEYFDLIRGIQLEYQTHPRLRLWFGPPGPQWVSDGFMQAIAEKAEQWGLGIQTHVVESIYEMMHGLRSYGKHTVMHLKDLGVLSPRFSLAHGVWLTQAEIEVLGHTGASVVHNPSSNLRLRAGIAPLNGLLQAGVNVALGKDGTGLNDDEDIFTEMRMGMRLHRSPAVDGPAPTAQHIFALATQGGAKLLREEGRLGRIAPGYAADLALLSLDRITWPWVAPEVDPRDLILYRAKAMDVDTVLIGGEVVLQGGMPTGFDMVELGQQLADRLEKQPFPHNDADLISEVTPYLEEWYARWETAALEPWIRYNSRS